MSAQFRIRLSQETIDELNRLAREHGSTFSEEIRAAIRGHLYRQQSGNTRGIETAVEPEGVLA